MVDPELEQPQRVIGRYALHGKLAAGSMATVHFGRLLGPAGFSRTVAIKRLHPHFAKDPEFVAMFLDEARLAARIQHPNVVATLDVVAKGEELFLVMDYVRGESLARLLRASRIQKIDVPVAVIASIVTGLLHGLHAAHEAKNEHGEPLSVVHRAVSPQNVLVGVDGVARVIDFGVAKAAARVQVTRDGQMKGRLSYMAPEQLENHGVDRRTDIFAAGVVLWEALTGRRLFDADDPDEVLRMIVADEVPPPSAVVPSVTREIDAIVLKALSHDPRARFQTAREFAIALEKASHLASPREVGEWVEVVAGDILVHRERQVAELESNSPTAEPAIFKDDSRPAFMKTLDDRTPVPERRAGSPAGEWDEAPTGVFEPGKGAAELLAARARSLAGRSAGKPPLPSASRPPLPGARAATPAPAEAGSRPPASSKGGKRTLVGGVSVLPVQIFDNADKTQVKDPRPLRGSSGPGAPASAAFDDEQETTTVYDSHVEVAAGSHRGAQLASEEEATAVFDKIEPPPVSNVENLITEVGLDGRTTLPPRKQNPATAKAAVGQDGVATIIVQERPVSAPPPASVQIANIQKRADFWSSPVARVGLIAMLVGLAATLGLLLGKSRARPPAAPAAVELPREEPRVPVLAEAPAAATEERPTAARPPAAAAEPKEPAATVEEAPEPARVESSHKASKTSTARSRAAATWKPPAPAKAAPPVPAPAPATATAAPRPSPAPAKPIYEESLDLNPYAGK